MHTKNEKLGLFVCFLEHVPGDGKKKMTRSKREQEKQRAYRKNKLFRRIEADIKERDRKRVPG